MMRNNRSYCRHRHIKTMFDNFPDFIFFSLSKKNWPQEEGKKTHLLITFHVKAEQLNTMKSCERDFVSPQCVFRIMVHWVGQFCWNDDYLEMISRTSQLKWKQKSSEPKTTAKKEMRKAWFRIVFFYCSHPQLIQKPLTFTNFTDKMLQ